MRYIFTIIFLIACTTAHAQLHNAHWFFGDFCGIKFTGAVPAAIASPNISCLEGSSSYSDPSTGALILSTDGISAWDKNHNLIPGINGTNYMHGHYSSTHGSVIIPNPDTPNQLYIFTTPAQVGALGDFKDFEYNVFDLNLNGGTGGIVSLNNVLHQNTSEKIAVYAQQENKAYWILTHPFYNDTFYAYKFSKQGISAPVKSKVGVMLVSPDSQNISSMGQMVFSPSGNYVAAAHVGLKKVQVYNFDKLSGSVTSVLFTDSSFGNIGPYGVCFSGDGSRLYVTEYALGTAKVFQYDMTAATGTAVLASRTAVLNSTSIDKLGGLIRGQDGKIYMSLYGSNSMPVINSPDQLGSACNLVLNGFTLQSTASLYSGVPTIYNAVILDTTAVSLGFTDQINASTSKFQLFPNPASTSVKFLGTSTLVRKELLDATGKLLLSTYGSEIDLQQFAKGFYFVKIGDYSQKLILQ
ncbi:MAG: hypothetical protein RL660_2936 [Bacteroidota bacterium]|jgi:hypothetical protein